MRDVILRSNSLAKIPVHPDGFPEFSPENSFLADNEVCRG
jgi:hypothetical protein